LANKTIEFYSINQPINQYLFQAHGPQEDRECFHRTRLTYLTIDYSAASSWQRRFSQYRCWKVGQLTDSFS